MEAFPHDGSTGWPAKSVALRTRTSNTYGSASALPSTARNELPTVTLYVMPGVSGAAGLSRIVTGSRHSSCPATAGSTVRIVLGSTVRSSEPATGLSKVTEISVVGAARAIGMVRITRNGLFDGDCAGGTAPAQSSGHATARRMQGIDR